MALPMAHLLAAYRWAADKPGLRECPEYYLGAIAPDAIHIRDGSDKSNKDFVHFYNWRRPDEVAAAAYWIRNRKPFDMGYGTHILLDGNWAESFRRDFPQILRPDRRPVPELYYHDTYNVDRDLYESSPLTPFFFDMLEKAVASEGERLTADEFTRWRDQMIEFYRKPHGDRDEARFITVEYTMQFIERVTSVFTRVYERALDDC